MTVVGNPTRIPRFPPGLVQVRLGLGALSHLIGVGDEAQSERDKLA